jgi:hypothetical protein
MHTRLQSPPPGSLNFVLLASLAVLTGAGCGQLKSYQATEQILLSNAVDEAVQNLDFTPLSGKKVFVDTTYVRDGKQYGSVHDGYLISSVRQQMMADGCLLFDKREDAEVIVEARVGTLGSDAHEITYGLPASNALSSAASAVGSPAPIPAMPEISLAKKTQNDGAAKLALFAFDAKTREPLWQSGVSLAKTTSANTWLLGAGPWPKNSWRERLFGSSKKTKDKSAEDDDENGSKTYAKVTFSDSHVFPALRKSQFEKETELIAKSSDSQASARLVDESDAPADEKNGVQQASAEVAKEDLKAPPSAAPSSLASSAALGQ